MYLLQMKHEQGMKEPGRPPGVTWLLLQSQKKRCSALSKLLVYLSYSAAVGECWGTGLLVQCSGCGVLFLSVWLCVTACLWLTALCCFGFPGIPGQ